MFVKVSNFYNFFLYKINYFIKYFLQFSLLDCHPSCKKCTGSLFTDCQGECVSKTRGNHGLPVDGICDCASGTIETLEKDCPGNF